MVRPMAFVSLESSDDECKPTGKLNFRFAVDGAGFVKYTLEPVSSGEVKITSGVNMARVGFVIIFNCFSAMKINDR